VERPLNTALGWRLPNWLLDYGPVAFVLLTGLAVTWGRPPVEPYHRVVPALLIVVIALAVRHRFPLGTLVVVLAMSLAFDYKAIVVLPALLAVFNAVEYTARPQMVVAITIAAVTVLLAPIVHGVPLSFTSIISRLVAVGLAVSAGLYLRARADYILGLRERAERLERERELLAENAVTEERVRIARELHDVVAHNVSLMVVQAQALAATGGDRATQVETLGRIGDLGREAMSEMHRMLGVLRLSDGGVAEREPQPGVRDLPALVARTREAGLAAELTISGEPRELTPVVDLSIYRIVQEALTNVIRHAMAAHAAVRLAYLPRAIEVTVLDDGHGPDAVTTESGGASVGEGHGLVGMRERVAMFGGELVAGRRIDGHRGYRVHALFPGS
jgi:signal transduction histidine kinase